MRTEIEQEAASEGREGKFLDLSGEDDATEEATFGEGERESTDEEESEAANDGEDGELAIFGGLDFEDEDEDEEDEESPFALSEEEDDQGDEEQEGDDDAGEANVTQETLRLRLSQQREKYKGRIGKLEGEVEELRKQPAEPPKEVDSPLGRIAKKLYGEFEDPDRELQFDNHFVSLFLDNAKTDSVLAQAKERMSALLEGKPMPEMKTNDVKEETKAQTEQAPNPELEEIRDMTRNSQVKEYMSQYPIRDKCVQPLRKEMLSHLKTTGKKVSDITDKDLDAAAKAAMDELSWDADFVMEKKKPAKKAAPTSGQGRAAVRTDDARKPDAESGERKSPQTIAEWQKARREEIGDYFPEGR